jgi:hypothetical protein
MAGWLKRHPFAVEAFFDRSIVLAYAFPAALLRDRLPSRLSLDTYREEHAFVAVAAVQTRRLRPKGLPGWLGRDFLLVGYRIFARYESRSGRRLRGLYILGSETNKRSMAIVGNLLTRYRYAATDVALTEEGSLTTVSSADSGLLVRVDRSETESLPAGTPFENLAEARKFAGPLPFTFSVEEGSDTVVIVEGVRTNWTPRPVRVVEHRVPFVEALGEGAVLANAFMVEDVAYWWRKGVVERWRR